MQQPRLPCLTVEKNLKEIFLVLYKILCCLVFLMYGPVCLCESWNPKSDVKNEQVNVPIVLPVCVPESYVRELLLTLRREPEDGRISRL